MSMLSGQDDLSTRLRIMDEAGVGIQVLSIGPLNLGWSGASHSITARRINDGFADFAGSIRNVFASLPLCLAAVGSR
jgi:hypothetical protein